MLILHHLGMSQSDRVVWLCEELGVPYTLRWYNRGADGLMPPEYLALHPAATAPVLQDGDRMLSESAVILEYICHRYAGGKLTIAPSDPNYFDYLYWMHFNNNVQGLFFAKLAGGGDGFGGLIARREDRYYRFLDQRLASAPYLAGPEFTCADIMVTFNLTSLSRFGGRVIDDLPHVTEYVTRITQRPAYARAMEIAGPTASPPPTES